MSMELLIRLINNRMISFISNMSASKTSIPHYNLRQLSAEILHLEADRHRNRNRQNFCKMRNVGVIQQLALCLNLTIIETVSTFLKKINATFFCEFCYILKCEISI